jgi:predicted secreted hydrolase
LKAETDDFGLELFLDTQKPPVIHGERGISRKGSRPGDASHYYSMTRLDTEGTLRLGDDRLPVHGMTWMDHEFGSGDLSPELAGWDWFSMHLDNQVELMLYVLRQRDGTPHPASSGTIVLADGRAQHFRLSDIALRSTKEWQSPHSGGRYPSRWTMTLPAWGLTLELVPRLADQELRTSHSTQVTYWEGAVSVTGTHNAKDIHGQGYVELTGYAGSIP